jgi:organic radical activating enzyme
MSSGTESDFYCSQKFWFLTIDIGKIETSSCCSSTTHRIDLKELQTSTGEIFNSPEYVNDRRLMLANAPVTSCSTACWDREAQGKLSRRLVMGSNKKTHTNINTSPELLNIILGIDCNLSCVYCCKKFSSSWYHDLQKNGPYAVVTGDSRFTVTQQDAVHAKIGQKQALNSSYSKILVNEIISILDKGSVKEIEITGGEPFLYLGLSELVTVLAKSDASVQIWSGLGVNPSRFKNEVRKLKDISNIHVVVSAESTGSLYEFVRFGNTWEQFLENISILEEEGIAYSFSATLTNITITGITDFLQYLGSRKVNWAVCNDPIFLSMDVLDPVTKEKVFRMLDYMPSDLAKIVKNNLLVTPSETSRQQFGIFIKEFASRRSAPLDVLPSELLIWADKNLNEGI